VSAVAAVTLTLAALPGPSAAAPVMTIAVDPDVGLVDAEVVSVTLDGMTPGAASLRQCRAAPAGRDDCGRRIVVGPGIPSSLTVRFVVRAVLSTPTGPVDCRTTACSLLVEQEDFGRTAEAPVAFDPAGPVVAPTVTAAPTTGLVGRQAITIAGRQWVPGTSVYVDQCRVGGGPPSCSAYASTIYEVPGLLEAGVGVSWTHTHRARTVLVLDHGQVDCRRVACELRVRGAPGPRVAFPLSFRSGPSGPGPGPDDPTGPVAGGPAFTG